MTGQGINYKRYVLMPIRRLALALLVCATVFAQVPVGSIAGVVKDPSGAVVAGAAVTTTSLADAGKRQVASDDQGFFLIPTLMPGEYKLVVEAKGFRNYEVQRVGVAVGQTARVDVNLTVGTETVAIEVAGGGVATVHPPQTTGGGGRSTPAERELSPDGRNS